MKPAPPVTKKFNYKSPLPTTFKSIPFLDKISIFQFEGYMKKINARLSDMSKQGKERLNKVREVDVKCIIDLSRRPGSVVVEKAGKTQSIMAVKRTGDINILENRVTKHILRKDVRHHRFLC